jgi:hypothetical protein
MVKPFKLLNGYTYSDEYTLPAPIDETYPEYYNTNQFIFCDVTEERLGMDDGLPYKVMLFRSIEEGNTIEGNTIYPPHPMYNFPDII